MDKWRLQLQRCLYFCSVRQANCSANLFTNIKTERIISSAAVNLFFLSWCLHTLRSHIFSFFYSSVAQCFPLVVKDSTAVPSVTLDQDKIWFNKNVKKQKKKPSRKWFCTGYRINGEKYWSLDDAAYEHTHCDLCISNSIIRFSLFALNSWSGEITSSEGGILDFQRRKKYFSKSSKTTV